MKKIRNIIITILIIGGVGYGGYIFLDSQVPKSEDFSVAVDIIGANHIQVGSAHGAYNSNPPTSGWHYANTAKTGFYDAHDLSRAPADEYIVHNLEHGDIWIAYHPRIGDDAHALEKFAGKKVIITPREANDYDISLVAWGRLDSFNLSGTENVGIRITDFIRRYKNKGPERVF